MGDLTTPSAGLPAQVVRRTGRFQRLLVAAVIALALIAGLVVWHVVHRGSGLGAEATVTASSTRLGSSPRDVVSSGRADRPGAGWQSAGSGKGAWIDLRWPHPIDLHEVVIVRNPLTEPGATEGYLSFGDGSRLFVTLSTSSRITRVPLTPRSTDRVRLTLSSVQDDAPAAIDEIVVREKDGPDSVDTAGGDDVASAATLSSSITTSPLGPLTDATAPGSSGEAWSADAKRGDWIELRWAQPEEVSSIVLRGSTGGAQVGSADLVFSSGAPVRLGAVLPDPRLPTTLGFMPRVVTSVRVVLDEVEGSGPLRLSEIEVYRVGSTPPGPDVAGSFPRVTDEACPGSGAAQSLEVLCPTNGSGVDDEVALQVALGAGYTSLDAEVVGSSGQEQDGVRASRGTDGIARPTLDLSGVPAGPLTVALVANGPGVGEKTARLQLVKGPGRPGDLASSRASAGRTLLFAEEFHHDVSTSRSGAGALYASAKSASTGSEDFGDAVFADPSEGLGNMTTVDDQYLAMNVVPRPSDVPDPQGWGRQHIGAMLASARTGGSGLSAQYGYFEARMYAPAMPGTWPAFWLLPSDNLAQKQPVVAEIDAVELYGHDPQGSCSTTHSYLDGKDDGKAQCGRRFDTTAQAVGWHTYGVQVLPDVNVFFIDGKEVARAAQVDGGASPMFFLVNLALGGGWPVELDAVRDRATLYVDYVRVYV